MGRVGDLLNCVGGYWWGAEQGSVADDTGVLLSSLCFDFCCLLFRGISPILFLTPSFYEKFPDFS